MPGAFLERDLSAIFNSKHFGEDAVVINGVSVPGAIFDNRDIEVQTGEGFGQIVPQPMVTCRASVLSPLASGQIVVARGQSYRLKNWKDDGVGIVEIYLEGPLP